MNQYSYLALGDSYTIGEQVSMEENFPHQAVQLLRKKGLQFSTPDIIATTGWTTDELDIAIDAAVITKQYDIVSLLIGVNNQFRGRSSTAFKVEFDHLVQRSIQFAANNASHVFVLSIPDWGVTPFAEGRDRKQIAVEIDNYNSVCKAACHQHRTHFIDITISQRGDGNKEPFLAADKLHPSGREYAKWAKQMADLISKEIFS